MFVYDKSKLLEHNIRQYLTEVRQLNPDNYLVLMFTLYNDFQNACAAAFDESSRYHYLSAGIFNQVIGSMKKAGIIGTAKGSTYVFLSNLAWESYLKDTATTALAGSTTANQEGGQGGAK